jgi:hypothetical protein
MASFAASAAARERCAPAHQCRLCRRLWWAILVMFSPYTHAQRAGHAYESEYRIVRAILEQPESRMDLGTIKLDIDRMIDPATDETRVLRQLDGMASDVKV